MNISRWIMTPVWAALVVAAGVVGYRLTESRIAMGVYRDRLQALNKDYEQLRSTYNQAVQKTAVTELLIQGKTLCVTIRTAEGVVKTLPTPFDPSREIYVDYVVIDGRLYCLDEGGDVWVLAADREYRELGHMALGEPTRATPAVAGGRLYLRTESRLFCLGEG